MEDTFNLTVFTDVTKNICMCTMVSIIIIILFIVSPLSNFFKTSLFMKVISLIVLGYIIFLNNNLYVHKIFFLEGIFCFYYFIFSYNKLYIINYKCYSCKVNRFPSCLKDCLTFI